MGDGDKDGDGELTADEIKALQVSHEKAKLELDPKAADTSKNNHAGKSLKQKKGAPKMTSIIQLDNGSGYKQGSSSGSGSGSVLVLSPPHVLCYPVS